MLKNFTKEDKIYWINKNQLLDYKEGQWIKDFLKNNNYPLNKENINYVIKNLSRFKKEGLWY